MIFATGRFAVQAFVQADRLDWKAQIFVSRVATAANLMQLSAEGGANKHAEGAISITFLKDPTSGKWARDPGIVLYRKIMRRYDPRGNPRDLDNLYGMAVAFTMVDTLEKAGRSLTRPGVLKAATSLDERNNPFLLPGIVVRTSPTNHFPILEAELARWHGNRWVPFGGLVATRARLR
jgi:branched-chain amino acid transport system substrate-binding protein